MENPNKGKRQARVRLEKGINERLVDTQLKGEIRLLLYVWNIQVYGVYRK